MLPWEVNAYGGKRAKQSNLDWQVGTDPELRYTRLKELP